MTLEGHAAEVWTMAMSRCVELGGPPREANAQSAARMPSLRIRLFVTMCVSFSRGEFFVTGSNDRSIRVWSRSGGVR